MVERSAVNRLVVGSNPTSGAIRRACGLLMASGRAENGPELAERPSDGLHIFIPADALFVSDRAGLFTPSHASYRNSAENGSDLVPRYTNCLHTAPSVWGALCRMLNGFRGSLS